MFSIGGGKNKSKGTSSTNNTLDPWSQGRIEDYSARIEAMIPQAQSYTGNLNVGTNPFQQQAASAASSLFDYTPQTLTAKSLAGADLSPYMDAGLEGNIQRTLQGVERNRQMQQVADNQSATAAHAFGGARHGVADSLTNAEYGRIAADTEGNMRTAALQRAQDLFGQDAARDFAAQSANAQLGLQGRQLGLAGAGLLANLGGQQADIDTGNIGRNYAEFARMQSLPYQNIGVLQNLLGMTPTIVDSKGQTKSSGSQLQWGWSGGGGGGGGGGGMDPNMMAAIMAMSDRRAKEDVSFVETDAKGRRWYDFRYIGDPTVHRGVMAQDLLAEDPNHPAVHMGDDGFYRVNYGAL